jgi:hypothetical protein
MGRVALFAGITPEASLHSIPSSARRIDPGNAFFQMAGLDGLASALGEKVGAGAYA